MTETGSRCKQAALFGSLLALCALITATDEAPAAANSSVSFEHTVIDGNGPKDIWLKAAGDLNGDGRIDLLAGGRSGGGLFWYQNPGWAKHAIDSAGAFSTDGEVVDVNGDGKPDVVALTPKALVWYSQPGWKLHPIEERTLHDVDAADLDRDGKVDLVARNQGAFKAKGDDLHLYKQETPSTWKHRSLQLSDNGEGLTLADLDADGDLDIVVERFWLENRGDIFGEWPPHEYGAAWTHPHTAVATGDLNGDGRLDIVLAPAELAGEMFRISWFEAPVDPKSGKWVEHVVDPQAECVHHFAGVADFNKDGRLDIATAEMAQGQKKEVKIYVNGGAGKQWAKEVVATTASHSMRIVDVDEDGYPDLYGANWRSNIVELWRNSTGRLPKP